MDKLDTPILTPINNWITLNYMSPMQFEQRWLAEQRKKAA